MNRLKFLLGMYVTIDHPVTCANPERWFKVIDARIENDKLFVRGEKTIWFDSGMILAIREIK